MLRAAGLYNLPSSPSPARPAGEFRAPTRPDPLAVTFIALVIAFALEQLQPLPARSTISALAATVADSAERRLNAGRPRHGMVAWLLLVAVASLGTYAVYLLAAALSWLLALAFSVAVLYVTMGFRQFSHPFTEIRIALANGDLAAARRELTEWRRGDDPAFDATTLELDEVVRQTLEYGMLKAQRHVFGTLFWYGVLAWAVGPAGAVLYRLSDYLARRWNEPRPLPPGLEPDRFGEFARRAFAWIDWLPARLTALGFAIVGDFEGTLYCWRRVAARPAGEPPVPDSRSLLLAAAGGAIGVRLMGAEEAARVFAEPGQEGAGLSEPQPRSLAQAAALMWRAVLLWLALLLLLSVVAWAS